MAQEKRRRISVGPEFGDLTQIATANLAARYHDPSVAAAPSSACGRWAVGGLAIIGGRKLLRLVPFVWIVRVAAAIMAVLAVISLVAAITD